LLPLAPVVVWPLIVLALPVLLLEEPIPAPLELLGLVLVVPLCESVGALVPEEFGVVFCDPDDGLLVVVLWVVVVVVV
jgi:hypothetical protein